MMAHGMKRGSAGAHRDRASRRLIPWVMCIVLHGSIAGVRADWPQFRGPKHDGISSETGLRFEWKEPIPLVWERNVGSAFSSFACVGDRVYTGGSKDKMQVLYCLNANTGEVIWENAFEPEYREGMGGDGPRATPTVFDGRVYMLGARGLLYCAEADTGKEIWKVQFTHMPQWGYSASVLIEGDLAISTGGKDHGAMAAFDRLTGAPRWKVGDDPAGYATPYPFTFEGTRYIAGFTGTAIVVMEAASGKEVWRDAWKTDWDVNAAAPIFHDGYLFVASGYDTGSGLYKLRKDGDRLAVENVWKNKVFLAKFQSCILHEGKLYGSDQNALVCADFLTGKELWRVKKIRNGTLVLVDGHLVMQRESGELEIGKASAEGWSPGTKAEILSDRCWSVPVIHRGKLYTRSIDRVVCFDLSDKSATTQSGK